MERECRARFAALSVLLACACARLLRADGRIEHAARLEAGVDEAARIMVGYLDQNTLIAAMAWARDQLCRRPGPADDWPSANRTLH